MIQDFKGSSLRKVRSCMEDNSDNWVTKGGISSKLKQHYYTTSVCVEFLEELGLVDKIVTKTMVVYRLKEQEQPLIVAPKEYFNTLEIERALLKKTEKLDGEDKNDVAKTKPTSQ